MPAGLVCAPTNKTSNNMLDKSLIADLPPFVGMETDSLEKLISAAKAQRYAKDTHIFRQGATAEHFYLLLDGHLRVVKVTEHGEQVIARYISTGELFGIAVAISRDIYPANAIAAVDCVALVWPNSVWQPTIEKNPSFATNTYRTIGDRLQETQDRLVELSTERVEQRVASALLKLVRQTGKQTDDGVLIDFPISRQDLSEMTGTTLHTVSRLLSAWEIAGLIKSGRQRITVVEDHKVMRIAHGQK